MLFGEEWDGESIGMAQLSESKQLDPASNWREKKQSKILERDGLREGGGVEERGETPPARGGGLLLSLARFRQVRTLLRREPERRG